MYSLVRSTSSIYHVKTATTVSHCGRAAASTLVVRCAKQTSLPVINLSNKDLVKPGTKEWNSVRTKVREAFEEHGCFEALYDDGEGKELQQPLFKASKELFELPVETKMKHFLEKPFTGYIGPKEGDEAYYEGMYIYDVACDQQFESFANLMWPRGNPNFRDITSAFGKLMMKLDQMVKRMVVESFGLEIKHFDALMESMVYQFGLQRYKTGMQNLCHTDRTFSTIIYQNEVDALEIETKDGEWIRMNLSPSSFVIVAGEVMMAWSNGRFHTPNHNVRMHGDATRYSAGLFSTCKGITKTPEELVDEQHPLRFKPFNHTDYLLFAHNHNSLQLPIEAYCGL